MQELHREFVEQNQKQKHDVEMRRKHQELEDRVTYNLVQAERDREQQIRKVTHFMHLSASKFLGGGGGEFRIEINYWLNMHVDFYGC